jgi:hypothetical protein
MRRLMSSRRQDYDSQQIFVRRSWTGGKVGKPKSAASKAPVPMVPLLAGFIRQWQEQTPYCLRLSETTAERCY